MRGGSGVGRMNTESGESYTISRPSVMKPEPQHPTETVLGHPSQSCIPQGQLSVRLPRPLFPPSLPDPCACDS